jgi:hypothetical protein
MDGYGDRKGTDQERKRNRGFKEKRIMKEGKGGRKGSYPTIKSYIRL